MKGLLLKDFMNIMRNKKLLILLFVFYIGLGFFMDSNVSVCGMMVFFLSYQLLTAFSFDEAGKWERFAMTMPLSRRQLVNSKYILMLLLVGLGFLLSCVTGGILNVIHPVEGESFREIVVAAAGVSAAFLILFSLMMPFIFWLGMEKARLLLIICFALPALGVYAVVSLVRKYSIPMPGEEDIRLLISLVPVFLAGITAVSWLISVRVFRKKEL